MMLLTHDIQTVMLPGRCTAVVRAELPAEELPAWLAGTFGAVHDYLRRTGTTPSGPPFARLAFLGTIVAVEAGFPVPREVGGDGLVEPSTLPGGPAVVVTHLGRYEELAEVFQTVYRWLDEHGRTPIGPHWEIYYTDPTAEPDPARWRTDVVLPFRPA